MELEEIWSLEIEELEKYANIPETMSIGEASVKVAKKLYDENKLDEKQRFIVENKNFSSVAKKHDVIHDVYKELKIKFNNDYVNKCSKEQLLDFVNITSCDEIVNSDAHRISVIVKLIKDDLFYDSALLKTKTFTKKQEIKIEKEDIKSIDDYANYIYKDYEGNVSDKDIKELKKELEKCDSNDISNIVDYVKIIMKHYKKPAKIHIPHFVKFVRGINNDVRFSCEFVY